MLTETTGVSLPFTLFRGSEKWWTVCGNHWSYDESLVVCKQLGYPSAREPGAGASFESGRGRVWMEGVNCTGRESQLADCSFQSVVGDVHNCSHGTQATVVCSK